ncbi:hypothetical protein P171DRAFT_475406 [Karstenula rhodostoma CBS 690.94]|uniref:Uncharacterized protein n=1 Tax=Karstenula rhodostoma CBS 690.94 TaxID=1392251 RepID=A0A9P4PDC5_9PLEO|nr:hypothetical protein P171DRAFT_475406 [Karstenula rhodostoma CBS 690.94]
MSSFNFARMLLHLVAFLGLLQCTLGNFDVYRIDIIGYPPNLKRHARDIAGNETIAGPPNNTTMPETAAPANSLDHYWSVLPHDWVCRDVLDARRLVDRKDVSGNKLGVRCNGDGCINDHSTDNLDLIEMHWTNIPLFHWTLYKDRLDDSGNQILWGVDGGKYGACKKIGTPGKWDICTDRPVGFGATQTIFVHKKFQCWSGRTAELINGGR